MAKKIYHENVNQRKAQESMDIRQSRLQSKESYQIQRRAVGLAGVGWRGGEKMQTTVIEQQQQINK